MKQAIGYVRVSTPKQGESGFGMDAQRAQIEKYAQLTGYRLTKVFTEVASAMGDAENETTPVESGAPTVKAHWSANPRCEP